MSRKMTVVFHNEELYTDLKVEAARRHMAASDIIAEAVQNWLDEEESKELKPILEQARSEYEAGKSTPWPVVKREMDEILAKREKRVRVAAEKRR